MSASKNALMATEGYAYGARYEVSGTSEVGFLWELEWVTSDGENDYASGTESTQSVAIDAAERVAKRWHCERLISHAIDLIDEIDEADVLDEHRDLALKLMDLKASASKTHAELMAYEADRK